MPSLVPLVPMVELYICSIPPVNRSSGVHRGAGRAAGGIPPFKERDGSCIMHGPGHRREGTVLQRIEHGGILELKLHRPPVNALNLALLGEIAESLERAPGEGADAVVLSGSPGLFTGGLDLVELAGLDDEGMVRFVRTFFRVLEAAARIPVPLVAAITGHGPAGGTVISLYCDRRIAAQGPFSLGFSEAQIGIVMPRSILSAMELRLGWRVAADLAVSGRLFDPEEALRLGVVDELVEPDGVVPAALSWLEGLLALPREPMLETRRRARQPLVEALSSHLGGAPEAFLHWWRHPQARAALEAALARIKGGG